MPRNRRILYHAGFLAELRRDERVSNLWTSAPFFDMAEFRRCSTVGNEVSFCCRWTAFVAGSEAALEVDAIAAKGVIVAVLLLSMLFYWFYMLYISRHMLRAIAGFQSSR